MKEMLRKYHWQSALWENIDEAPGINMKDSTFQNNDLEYYDNIYTDKSHYDSYAKLNSESTQLLPIKGFQTPIILRKISPQNESQFSYNHEGNGITENQKTSASDIYQEQEIATLCTPGNMDLNDAKISSTVNAHRTFYHDNKTGEEILASPTTQTSMNEKINNEGSLYSKSKTKCSSGQRVLEEREDVPMRPEHVNDRLHIERHESISGEDILSKISYENKHLFSDPKGTERANENVPFLYEYENTKNDHSTVDNMKIPSNIKEYSEKVAISEAAHQSVKHEVSQSSSGRNLLKEDLTTKCKEERLQSPYQIIEEMENLQSNVSLTKSSINSTLKRIANTNKYISPTDNFLEQSNLEIQQPDNQVNIVDDNNQNLISDNNCSEITSNELLSQRSETDDEKLQLRKIIQQGGRSGSASSLSITEQLSQSHSKWTSSFRKSYKAKDMNEGNMFNANFDKLQGTGNLISKDYKVEKHKLVDKAAMDYESDFEVSDVEGLSISASSLTSTTIPDDLVTPGEEEF
ncbi:hypothetical protein SK128_024774 [Halocaridina rubra]|uniref:Uncharacterized protein n=1 Tax=Halocaridina rubra TaxID=373956 RepID=A0AAN8XGM1_HALRR